MRQPDWDERTVIIGKKASSAATKANPSARPKPSTPSIVDVYIGDTFVAAVPKKLLTRFSAVANDAYSPTGNMAAAGHGGAVEFPGTASLTDAPNGSSNPRISFSLLSVSIQPSRNAVQSCIDWMNKHAAVSGDVMLDALFVENPEDTPLTELMDLHAAATCMALRPIGHHLRNEVLERVTETIPEVAMIQHVHERFRPGTYVHEQMVKVYLNCVEQESLTEEGFKLIDDYIASNDALAAALQEGKERRTKYWDGVERRRRAREREEWVAATRQARSDDASSSESIPGYGERRQMTGRLRAAMLPGNSKGVRGRHVPGA